MAFSSNQLQRLIKKKIDKSSLELFVICPLGFEEDLKKELESFGLVGELEKGGVTLRGTWGQMMKINYCSRIATNVLLRIMHGYANSYPELFQKLKRAPYAVYQGNAKSINIKVSSKESRLHHTDKITQVFHDALKEKLDDDSIELHKEKHLITYHIRLFQDRFTLSVDTSGEPLYRRGYKVPGGKATIRENIAAGLLLHLNADKMDFFIDAFCGSGTFLFEFYLIKKNIAPGSFRNFSFEQMPMFKSSQLEMLKRDCLNSLRKKSFLMLGFDKAEGAILLTTKGKDKLNISDSYLKLFNQSFEKSLDMIPEDCNGLAVSNLPFNKRIKSSFLKSDFEKWLVKLEEKKIHLGFLSADRYKYFETFKTKKIKYGGLTVNFCFK